MEGDWGAGAIFRPGAYLVEVCEADVHLSHTHVLLRTAASHQAAEWSSPSSGHLLHRSSCPSFMPSSAPSLPPLDILSSHQAFATVAPGN